MQCDFDEDNAMVVRKQITAFSSTSDKLQPYSVQVTVVTVASSTGFFVFSRILQFEEMKNYQNTGLSPTFPPEKWQNDIDVPATRNRTSSSPKNTAAERDYDTPRYRSHYPVCSFFLLLAVVFLLVRRPILHFDHSITDTTPAE